MSIIQGATSFYIQSEHLESVLINLVKFSEKYHYECEKHIEDMQTYAATSYIMGQFGWNFIYDELYNIIDIKLAYLEPNTSHVIFKNIAAYVSDDSYVTLTNNGKLYCGWTFNGKKCKRMLKQRERRNDGNFWINLQAQPMILDPNAINRQQPQQFLVDNNVFIDFGQINAADNIVPGQVFEEDVGPGLGVNPMAVPEDFILEPQGQEFGEPQQRGEIMDAVFEDDLPF